MLTMGEPIKLKTVRPMESLGDGFAKRISGNYQMLEEQIEPSDMLHFITAAPELYTEEAGMAPLVNHYNLHNTQNASMQLINNVLNRILVSDTVQMTYQDRVFVENILMKMGVTDVREFIRQIRQTMQETNNTKELLHLYHSDTKVLQTIRELQRTEKQKQIKPERSEEAEEQFKINQFQQEIWNHLHTEEICQELSNLISVRYGNQIRVSRQEMMLSEPSINAEYLTLNRMRRETFLQQQDLVYNRVNTYEAGDSNLTEETYEQTVSNMVQAVLLNAIDQIYHIRYTDFHNRSATFQWLTDAIHVNAQNTLQRFESYHNRPSLSREEKEEYHKSMQNFEDREITVLQKLFEHKQEVTENRLEMQEIAQTELQYQTEENITEEQQDVIENTVREVTKEQENDHRHFYKISEKTREEEIRKQLEIINRQNVERLEKLRTLEQEQAKKEPQRINREQAKKDALRAIENPQEVVLEYLNSSTTSSETKSIERERLKEIMGEDTVRILEAVREYQENPQKHSDMITSEGQAMDLLMRDISTYQEEQQKDQEAVQQPLLHTRIKEETSKEVQKVLRETERYQTEHSVVYPEQTQAIQEQVELLHKQNETILNEELLEELENRNRKTMQSEVRTTTEETIETNHVTQLVTNKVNELQLKQDQNIERIISQNVRQQLNTLSDQVFNKLEKRMDAERRRRGI